MKQYRYINLSNDELIEVKKGYQSRLPHHFRQRCHALIMNHQKTKIPQIAILLGKRCDTIRKWFDNWEQDGLAGLHIKKGRGLKPTLKITDKNLVEVSLSK